MSFRLFKQMQGADIANEAIYIPKYTSNLHVSLFAWVIIPDSGAGTINPTLTFVDPSGHVNVLNDLADLNLASPTLPQSANNQFDITVQADTPVMLSVIGGGTYGNALYSFLLSLTDLSRPEQEDGCGALIPFAPEVRPQQLQTTPCGGCQRSPCCCQGQQPNVIVVPAQQPFFPPQPYYPPRRMLEDYYDDDDFDHGNQIPPDSGQWQRCCPQ